METKLLIIMVEVGRRFGDPVGVQRNVVISKEVEAAQTDLVAIRNKKRIVYLNDVHERPK